MGFERLADQKFFYGMSYYLLPELSDQPIPYFRDIPLLGRARDH